MVELVSKTQGQPQSARAAYMSNVRWYEVMPFRPPTQHVSNTRETFPREKPCVPEHTHQRAVVAVEGAAAVGDEQDAVQREHGPSPGRVVAAVDLVRDLVRNDRRDLLRWRILLEVAAASVEFLVCARPGDVCCIGHVGGTVLGLSMILFLKSKG